MPSIRQQLVDAVATRLGLIHAGHVFALPDGTYTCEVTPLSVTEWRKTPYGLAQVPAIAFWDTSATLGDSIIGRFEHRLEISVLCFTAGASAIDNARAMMADIAAAIGSDPKWTTISGINAWTEPGTKTLATEQAADVVSASEMTFTIGYRTPLWRM
jgi:hypothetical protein